jgi:hypothetical protein
MIRNAVLSTLDTVNQKAVYCVNNLSPAPIYNCVLTGGLTNVTPNGSNTFTSLTWTNSGTATILNATTSLVVAHGCSYTPTAIDISITPTATCTNDPGMIWVDTVGATNFTVNCLRDPGVSGLAFSWAVRKV